MDPKYILLPVSFAAGMDLPAVAKKLYQLQALRDIPRHGVKRGDIGGYVSSKTTLSQEGDCWISSKAIVLSKREWDKKGQHSISGNAIVRGAYIIKNSRISDDVSVTGRQGYIKECRLAKNTQILGEVTLISSDFTDASLVRSDVPPGVKVFEGVHIKITNSSFTHANIAGCGTIKNASSDKVFDVKDEFTIHLRPNNRLFRNIKHSFKASGNTRMKNNHVIHAVMELSGNTSIEYSHIRADKFVMNGGNVDRCNFAGLIDIAGNVNLKTTSVSGRNIFRDNVKIANCRLRGSNKMLGDTILPSGSQIENEVIAIGEFTDVDFSVFKPSDVENRALETPDETIQRLNSSIIQAQKTIEAQISTTSIEPVAEVAKSNPYIRLIQSIEAEYEAYTTDIVKLIKYPAMGDTSVPETRKLVVALRAARRAINSGNMEGLEDVSADLENAFVDAENKAIILAASFMDEKQKNSLKRAGQALSIALDENATEHERRAGYKSGMKSLEGVLPVSEKAVFALKERIGLKEIEA